MKCFKKYKVIVSILLFLVPVSAFAYSYSGYKWYRFPGTIKSVDIDPYGRNNWETAAIRNAMQSWSDAGANFQYVDVETSGNYFGYYYAVSGTLAYTHIDVNWLGSITRTYITVNTYQSWATNGDQNSYDFESMAVHELGHGLKLEHSGVIESTMYNSMPRGENKKRSLEIDDKGGIKYVYGSR